MLETTLASELKAINLSILDFKSYLQHLINFLQFSINLSILDFKCFVVISNFKSLEL